MANLIPGKKYRERKGKFQYYIGIEVKMKNGKTKTIYRKPFYDEKMAAIEVAEDISQRVIETVKGAESAKVVEMNRRRK